MLFTHSIPFNIIRICNGSRATLETIMKKFLCSLIGLVGVSSILASPFTPGDLVVVEVGGDGSGGALGSTATAAFLYEYTTSGSFVQSIAMPTTASGVNGALTLSGSATSEGFLKLSVDGRYLTLAGYNTAPGTASPSASAPTSIPRVVGLIDMNGNVNTSTILGDAYNGSNIRSAVSTDGTSLWTGGNGGSGQGASAGVRYTTSGSTSSTQINSTSSNMRVVNIYNGQLYVSADTGSIAGVATVGSGLPTSSIGGAPTILPGMPTTTTGHSPYDFWFKDPNTLYVADDGNAANGGGIQKWTQSGGTWTLAYNLLNNGTTTTGTRGLIGTLDGSGNALLYATTATNSIIAVDDLGSQAATTVNLLAGGVANTAFRGIAFIPLVPEPNTAAIIGLGLVGFAFLRRFRR